MINNRLVLAYIGNGKSANRYHLPFVLQRSDKFIVKRYLILGLDMIYGKLLMELSMLRMLIRY